MLYMHFGRTITFSHSTKSGGHLSLIAPTFQVGGHFLPLHPDSAAYDYHYDKMQISSKFEAQLNKYFWWNIDEIGYANSALLIKDLEMWTTVISEALTAVELYGH